MQSSEIIVLPLPGKKLQPGYTVCWQNFPIEQLHARILTVLNFLQYFRSCCIASSRHVIHRKAVAVALDIIKVILQKQISELSSFSIKL